MLLNLETNQATALTSGHHLNLDPAWSPDSKHLAYVSTAPNRYFNIYVMELNNGQKGNLVAVTRDHRFGRDASISATTTCTSRPPGRPMAGN